MPKVTKQPEARYPLKPYQEVEPLDDIARGLLFGLGKEMERTYGTLRTSHPGWATVVWNTLSLFDDIVSSAQ